MAMSVNTVVPSRVSATLTSMMFRGGRQSLTMKAARSFSQTAEGPPVTSTATGGLRLATLTRPKVLNSLNLEMVHLLHPLINQWNVDPEVNVIAMDGAGLKAFCAGGDVVAVAKSGRGGDDGGELAKKFFREEYALDYRLATLSKPYVAVLDGITMGGGVGLSVPADFKIATERCMFAMPETGIGLFPDVGGSFFLPRLKGSLGMYLALTGARLKGEDVVKAGIATHYIPSDQIEAVLSDLATISEPDKNAVAVVLDHYDTSTPTPASFEAHLDVMNECFEADSIEEILEKLENNSSEWAIKQKATIGRMSPTSLKITHRQLTHGRAMSLEECFRMEYRMTQGCMRANDFYEGIRALLIDKDNKPQWSPATLAEVTDDIIDDHFKPLENDINFPEE